MINFYENLFLILNTTMQQAVCFSNLLVVVMVMT